LDKRLLDILVCPATKGKLVLKGNELWSSSAGLSYPVKNGKPMLTEGEARQLSNEELASMKSSDSNYS